MGRVPPRHFQNRCRQSMLLREISRRITTEVRQRAAESISVFLQYSDGTLAKLSLVCILIQQHVQIDIEQHQFDSGDYFACAARGKTAVPDFTPPAQEIVIFELFAWVFQFEFSKRSHVCHGPPRRIRRAGPL